jgi:CheY-like chemotaxis protein
LTAQPRPAQRSTPAASQPERGLNILLAEDSIESQEILKLYLRGTPHQVDCASTGTRVVALFKEGRYDLVFMDLHMPEMDGLSATRLIRDWEVVNGRGRTPILALTANGMSEAQRESLEAGCDDYLTKPIKMEQLLIAIQRYKSTTPQGRPQSQQPPPDHEALDSTIELMRPKFLQKREQDVAALEAAIKEQNFEQIRTIGHRIKGLAGSYGLDYIGQIGGAIEQAALAKNIQMITQQVTQLVGALHRAQQTADAKSGKTHRAA